MNKAVEGFVAQITELARRAALDTLESSFGARVAGGGGRRAALEAVTSSASVGRPRGRSGAKRSAEDLEVLSTKFAAFVKGAARPAYRADQQGARHRDQGPGAADQEADRRGDDQLRTTSSW